MAEGQEKDDLYEQMRLKKIDFLIICMGTHFD